MFDMELHDKLFHKKIYYGQIINIREKYRVDKKHAYDGVPTVYYDILFNNSKVGTIDLRLTADGMNYYYGHIGYDILEKYRGHHYALEACKEVFKIAKDEFNLEELIITCSPDNIASYKTLTELNGELIELVDVPKGHPLYTQGEKQKNIFKYKL